MNMLHVGIGNKAYYVFQNISLGCVAQSSYNSTHELYGPQLSSPSGAPMHVVVQTGELSNKYTHGGLEPPNIYQGG